MPKKDKPVERDMEATLRALSIPSNLSPEEAVEHMADVTAGSDDEYESSSTTDVSIVVPPPRVLSSEPAEDDDSSLDIEFEASPLPSGENPQFLPNALVPPPKVARTQARKPPPGMAKLGILSKMAPGAEKAKISKRGTDGKMWFVNEYTKADLDAFSDYESFITQYVKPEHGTGEYEIHGLDATGRESRLGTVRLLPSPKQTEAGGAFQLVERVINDQKTQNEQHLLRLEKLMTPAPQVNPVTMLKDVMELQEKITGRSAGETSMAAAETGSVMAAALQSMTAASAQNMQLMMQMMAQQQAASDKTTLMIMEMMKGRSEPQSNPLMEAVIAKLLKEDSGGGGNLPPPPPPPPAGPSMVEMVTLIKEIMEISGAGGGGDDEFKEFLKQMMLRNEGERMDLPKTLALVKELTGSGLAKTDDFTDAIDRTAKLMNFAKNISQNQEAGGGATFMDVLAAFASNKDFAGSIANTIRSKTDTSTTSQQQALLAERQRLDMQKRLLERERANGNSTSPPSAPVQPTQQRQAPRPQRVVDVAQPRENVVETSAPTGPTPEEVRQAQENQLEATGKVPQLPVNIHDHLNTLMEAKDDPERVRTLIQMFIYLGEHDDWKRFVESMFEAIRTGNRKGTLYYVHGFLDGMRSINLITEELMVASVQAMHANFDEVQKQMQDFPLAKDEEITAEALVAEQA